MPGNLRFVTRVTLLYGELFYPLKVRLNYLDYASLKSDYLI